MRYKIVKTEVKNLDKNFNAVGRKRCVYIVYDTEDTPFPNKAIKMNKILAQFKTEKKAKEYIKTLKEI